MTKHDLQSLMLEFIPEDHRAGARPLVVHEPPTTGVGHGFAPAEELDVPFDLSAHAFSTSPVPLSTLTGNPVHRVEGHPAVVLIERDPMPTVLRGHPQVHPGGVLQLDTHRDDFVVLFRESDQDITLAFRRGRILECVTDRPEGSFEVATPSRVSVLQLPPYDSSALTGLGLQAWLLRRADRLAHAEETGPATAVGLVLRLGRPSGDAARSERLRMLAGEPSAILTWARDWLGEAIPSMVHELEGRVRSDASALIELLDGLTDALTSAPRDAQQFAADLVEQRDAGQSAARLLRLVGRHEDLQTVLRGVDDRVLALGATVGDALAGEHGLDPDWLGEVSWQEPDAWWGLFAEDA